MARPRVVIVGAGFAGLAAAKAFAGRPFDVTILDRHNYHLFTPLLYQVASSLLNPSDIAQPVRAILRRSGVAFRLAEVTGFDLERRTVATGDGDLPYDYLVVASGTTTNFFGNAALSAASHRLKTLPEALALRNHILACFEAAEWEADPPARDALLTFVIVGGGPTGVEYAGALSELINLLERKDFPALDFSRVRVILAEGEGAILAPFAERLREAARRALERKGVAVRLGAAVASFDGDVVAFRDGTTLDARTLVWVAGVTGSPLGAALADPLARGARVPVLRTLQLAGHPEVFVVGDLAAFEQNGRLVPQLAEVAMGQGRRAAQSIAAIAGGERPRAWHYRSKGIMATVGRNNGVAEVAGLKLSGLAGWLTWLFVHLILLVGFRRRLFVLMTWAWNYLFYDRPVRLIASANRSPSREDDAG